MMIIRLEDKEITKSVKHEGLCLCYNGDDVVEVIIIGLKGLYETKIMKNDGGKREWK